MKATFRILFGLCAALVIVALTTPASFAQCSASREFGGLGNGTLTGRVAINTGAFPNNLNEFKSFWDASKAAQNNSGGAHFGTPSLCTDNWYITGGTFPGVNSGIQGFIASLTCQMTNCVDPIVLSSVVEDQTADGKDAGFILYTVDESPSAIRYYDHARTAGTAGVPNATTLQSFQAYPKVNVTSSSGPPPTTTTTDNYADLAVNYHGAGATAAANSGVVSYDIVSFHGNADPGRLRSLWTPVKSIPYNNAGVVGDQVNVPCPTPVSDTYLAVGVTFDGDGNKVLSGGDIKSVLVGASIPVECNPNIAEPEPKVHRPVIQRKQPLGR